MTEGEQAGDPGGATGRPASSPEVPRAQRRRRRRGWIVPAVVAVVVAAFAGVTARLFVWPELAALPDRADAIVSLGGPGARAELALELYRQGRAPIVAVSLDTELANSSWCRRGVRDGVPVLCFHPDPFTTRGEARALAAFARQYGWHSVILVTSPDQAWRAGVRVGRCFDGAVAVATVPLPWSQWPLQLAHQWVSTAKAFTIETSC